MKKYLGKIIGISLIFLILSCALESKFSLPNDERIKTELIGEWSNEDDEILRIEKNNEKTYKLITIQNGKMDESIAFSKTINGFNILNIISEYEDKKTNVFYGFNIDNNTLTYSEVNDKLRESDFKSESELLQFFQKNISKKDFFVDSVKLKRK
ncbi:hypothetical protein [Psychroflexus halocasei]|uniref:Lipocalin-like domain-containing protein n=1 Tax=Psychroflexus halocasei TaxID=908615 RepID=A0A1H3Z9W7_9FLAO|nr:hypothetical protein [Psychroflexus halocasei]SEA20470.1 hypothetical protein SAMN05421540_1043 [Psychroflexus halocasei]